MWQKRIGWGLLGTGVACIVAGVAWIASVWSDDAARISASTPCGILIMGGILASIFGIGILGGLEGLDGFDWFN